MKVQSHFTNVKTSGGDVAAEGKAALQRLSVTLQPSHSPTHLIHILNQAAAGLGPRVTGENERRRGIAHG